MTAPDQSKAIDRAREILAERRAGAPQPRRDEHPDPDARPAEKAKR